LTVKVNLLTTTTAYEGLCKLADGRKRKVSVDKDTLNQLLIDHSAMINALRGSTTFKVTEPVAKRMKPKLE